MNSSLIKEFRQLFEQNNKVVLIVGDVGGQLYRTMSRCYPARCFNFGIAEANMVTAAAGMSTAGFIPIIISIVPHIVMRAYEQIRNDVCLNNNNVKIIGVGAGLIYSTAGPTHHSLEDIAVLRPLPNISIFSPATPAEFGEVLFFAVKIKGPVYIRLGLLQQIHFPGHIKSFRKGILINQGSDVTLVTTGSMVTESLKAARLLDKHSISTRVINITALKPLCSQLIDNAIRDTNGIVTVEEHSVFGGLGEAVAAIIAKSSRKVSFQQIGVKDTFCLKYGTYPYLRECFGLTAQNIVNVVKKLVGRRRAKQ